MAVNCEQANAVLFRRTPNFDKKIAKDRFPQHYIYGNMYPQTLWELGTGTTHTWDQVHVTAVNDDGCWDEVVMGGDGSATGCDSLCGGSRGSVGWGSTRKNYVRYRKVYQTPPFCYDQLRNVEEVLSQLNAIMEGLKKIPDEIVSGFIRLLSLRQAETIHIASDTRIEVDITADTFTNGCKNINLGSVDNLPVSQLTMQYLNGFYDPLQFEGYFDGRFLPQGTFGITMDALTHANLARQNPVTFELMALPEWQQGGRYWEYGMMDGKIGNWVFKYDPEPFRYQHIGGGVLQRIFPFENVAATTGKKKQYSDAYNNAWYQAYHVFNRDAREIKVGDISPVNADMKFNMSRSLLGKWSWKSPDYFTYTDPNTGKECAYNNDLHNRGYFVAEFELGAKTVYPLIERWIIALRQPPCVTNKPNCGTAPAMVYQSLTPYNSFCGEGD